jgi:uncharacterized protein YdeI (YjbR/CyaY-like superfamily)
MNVDASFCFETSGALHGWLQAHHDTSREIWVQVFKKRSGIISVAWDDCVVAAICWGWIDGQRKSLDDVSFLQRLTPSRPTSTWSKRNREHAERLMAAGQMQPAGLSQVQAARQDGRWDRAYAGSAEMRLPEDFLAELNQVNAAARELRDQHSDALTSRLRISGRLNAKINRIQLTAIKSFK